MSESLIVGVGGAGCDMACHVHVLIGNEFLAVNTDLIGMNTSSFPRRLVIGPKICKGGAAHTPARGRLAAEESHKELALMMSGSQTLILLAGLGGGTGSGALPVVAQIARDMGMNVFAAVSLPFSFEHSRRRVALESLHRLREIGAPIFVHDHAESEGSISFNKLSLDDILKKAGATMADHVSCRLNSMQQLAAVNKGHS